MSWTREEITDKLVAIKQRGFVKSKRKGPTGVGYTLEKLLGIKENNLYLPDLGEFELKARRDGHIGMTTLFTFNKAAWRIKPLDAVKRYGSENWKGRLGLYQSVTPARNPRGFQLSVDDDTLSLVNGIDQTTVLEWQLSEISKRFEEKVNRLLLVTALVDVREDIEYFKYHRAKLLSGGPSKETLKNKIQQGKVIVDLRLRAAKNHGTAFRVFEESLEDLYEDSVNLNI